MGVRSRLLIPFVAVALLGVPSAASAAPQTVRATASDTFTPKNVAVKPGEAVTFTNSGGDHNVVWNDGAVPPMPPTSVPPDQWTSPVSRTFTRTGRFRYYCALHGDPSSNFGMFGFVYVNTPGLLPPTITGLSTRRLEDAVRLRYTASRAGTATATFFRRVGRNFVRFGAASLVTRRGFNDKLVSRVAGRRLMEGSWRVTLVLADANRLRSESRTVTFTLV
jgi:plastocyanin